MTRHVLPQRRFCETFDLKFGGQPWCVTVGYTANHDPGEVFVSGHKSGSDMDAVARDGAILLSLALQYNVPLATIASALTRNADGTPSSVIGALADRLRRLASQEGTP